MPLDLHHSRDAKAVPASARRHPRSFFTVPVVLHHLTREGMRAARGISLDLSEGGLGALIQGQLRVGETVKIDLRIHEYSLNTVAIVRHTSSDRSGFEFLGLTAEERLVIIQAMGHS
jgi:hypothetical protein